MKKKCGLRIVEKKIMYSHYQAGDQEGNWWSGTCYKQELTHLLEHALVRLGQGSQRLGQA